MSSSNISSKTRPNYEPPAVFPPKLEHKQSMIILHGRHNNGKKFGEGMLNCQIPGIGTLKDALPHTRFIFPSATERRGMMFGNAMLIQWFDNWFIDDDPPEREDVQVDGLQDTTTFVHELLRKEIQEVGASNVALGGLSQGCVATLVSLLLWDGEPLAAAIGLAGWLPYAVPMTKIIKKAGKQRQDCSKNGGDEPTTAENGRKRDTQPLSGSEQAIIYFHEQLGKQTTIPPNIGFQQTAFFLGHGEQDPKVDFHLGNRATQCLKDLGARATFFRYPDLGHWYSKDMLADIVQFLRSNTSWGVQGSSI